jgi:hypothetical protein
MNRKPVHEMTLQELRDEVLVLRDMIDRPYASGPAFAVFPENRQPTTFRVALPDWAQPRTICGEPTVGSTS